MTTTTTTRTPIDPMRSGEPEKIVLDSVLDSKAPARSRLVEDLLRWALEVRNRHPFRPVKPQGGVLGEVRYDLTLNIPQYVIRTLVDIVGSNAELLKYISSSASFKEMLNDNWRLDHVEDSGVLSLIGHKLDPEDDSDDKTIDDS